MSSATLSAAPVAAAPPASAPQEATFQQVFEREGPFVYRALRYLGVSEADLDDLCQEVFLVVHRRLREFEGRSALRTWVYGIALRVAADYRKSAYVRRERPAQLPEQAAPCELDRAEARGELQRALDMLDDEKRAVLVLHELEGFSVPEIAELVGCPVQTAYTRLHVARDQVARQLRRSRLERGAP